MWYNNTYEQESRQGRVIKEIIFSFLNQNICCGYSKEASHRDASFEHPKQMLKLMVKKIFTILHSKMFIWNHAMNQVKMKMFSLASEHT